MSRTRISTLISDLDEANNALKEITIMKMELESIDSQADKEIGVIKDKAAKRGLHAREKIKQLETALASYGEYYRSELFKDKKTQSVSYGQFGFRESTVISVKKSTLDLILKQYPGGEKGIRTKKSVDKEELASWSDEELHSVNACRKKNDTFWYEENRDEVNKTLLGSK
jgi:phage host-nuclease inhibitor protein Gam